MLDSFMDSADRFGLIVDGQRPLCLALLVAAVCTRDDVAAAQLQDVLAECKGEEERAQAAKSVKATRRQWRRFPAEKRAAFRVECHKAGVLRYARASMKTFATV